MVEFFDSVKLELTVKEPEISFCDAEYGVIVDELVEDKICVAVSVVAEVSLETRRLILILSEEPDLSE